MDTLRTINGQPVDPTAAPAVPTLPNPNVTATATAAQLDVHKAECGNVGATGNHGELGSNAK